MQPATSISSGTDMSFIVDPIVAAAVKVWRAIVTVLEEGC